jgi:hypothetical protein
MNQSSDPRLSAHSNTGEAPMFERRHEALLPRSIFFLRLVKYGAISLGFILASLLIGILGYRISEDMSWIDAFVNAAMILGGMGPIGELHTDVGKLFAGIYALYCGLVAIISVGIIVAPVLHRLLHYFHLGPELDEKMENDP